MSTSKVDFKYRCNFTTLNINTTKSDFEIAKIVLVGEKCFGKVPLLFIHVRELQFLQTCLFNRIFYDENYKTQMTIGMKCRQRATNFEILIPLVGAYYGELGTESCRWHL